MTKEGTDRDGRHTRAGTKPKPLIDKIAKGKPTEVLDPTLPDVTSDIGEGADLEGTDMPNLPSICRRSKKTAHRLV